MYHTKEFNEIEVGEVFTSFEFPNEYFIKVKLLNQGDIDFKGCSLNSGVIISIGHTEKVKTGYRIEITPEDKSSPQNEYELTEFKGETEYPDMEYEDFINKVKLEYSPNIEVYLDDIKDYGTSILIQWYRVFHKGTNREIGYWTKDFNCPCAIIFHKAREWDNESMGNLIKITNTNSPSNWTFNKSIS